jgi:protein-S-isoprenylcysteine O-methyltransferase Ste14
MIAKLIATSFLQTAVVAALLLVPAGTLLWWRAWIYVSVMLVGTLAAAFGILRVNASLLCERLRLPIQTGQSLSDKILLPATITAFVGLLILIALDVFRLHLLAKPSAAASAFGLAIFIAGWWFGYLGMRENAFAVSVVKYQSDRNHTVVMTGPYRFVRHPMYAGGLLVFVGTPLWLESSAGALLAIIPVGLVVLRTVAEEGFLRRELSGYTEYVERVPYRLIPLVW